MPEVFNMNLFTYTKKISEKISYYDQLTKDVKKNLMMSNPFAIPVKMTVIWINNCKNDNSE